MISAFFIVLIAYLFDLLLFYHPTLTLPNAPIIVRVNIKYEIKSVYSKEKCIDIVSTFTKGNPEDDVREGQSNFGFFLESTIFIFY